MIRYDLYYYWNLQEVIKEKTTTEYDPWSVATFHTLFYTDFANAPVWKDSSTAKDYIEDLWQLIYARYYEEMCLYTIDADTNPTAAEIKAFFNRLINVLVLTYPKYSVLLKAYTDKQANLLDQISSVQTGIARFNDTPQTEENSEDFEDDDHVTNLTKTSATNSTDGMTPIERLKQIQDSFKSVLNDWCNEFNKIFIDEANISL